MRHEQHPSNNGVLGAPAGVPIEKCNALPITRIMYSDGTPVTRSFWRPDENELLAIMAGEPIAFEIWGENHAPICLGIAGLTLPATKAT